MAPVSTRTDRRRILVAGGAGLIGSAVVRVLEARGIEFLALDRRPGPAVRLAELADARVWRSEIERFGRPDAILLLAGVVGVARVLADPEAARRGNAAPLQALLEALECETDDALPRIVFASSSEVYLPANRPLREGDPVRDVAAEGRWAYAAAKVAGERDLLAARAWPEGQAPVLARFFNVVGPGQDSSQGMVLPNFIERASAGLPLLVHGDGEQVRTFAHVDEVARVLAEILIRDAFPGGPLNIGGAARSTVRDLASAVARAAGGGRIEHVDPCHAVHEAFEDVRWRVPDLTRLASLGLELPSMDLDGIVRDVLARHESATLACASPAS